MMLYLSSAPLKETAISNNQNLSTPPQKKMDLSTRVCTCSWRIRSEFLNPISWQAMKGQEFRDKYPGAK